MPETFDTIVIGTGPGGEGAAMQLAKGGQRVLVIERHSQIGGGCTHWGTIPSKALRGAINHLTESLKNPLLQGCFGAAQVSIAELAKSAQSVISRQVDLRRKFYERNNVLVVFGEAVFVDSSTVEVNGERYSARAIVVAVGSRPYRPDNVDFSHPRIFDSDSILGLRDRPQTMTIYGAGVVGCEYASMFRNLDIKINLINSRGRLLDFLDDEISDALSYHMREHGVVIRHNETLASIEPRGDGVIVHLESGKQLKSEVLLWAAGRTGNTRELLLDRAGLKADSRGYLAVDPYGETEVAGIFAVGDVVGFPSLASAAYTQGRTAARRILQLDEPPNSLEKIPSGIYTSPEISSIGKTERELTGEKRAYEVGIAHFRSIARAQIIGQTSGVLKILFCPDSLEVLGVHCFGANASEIIHIGQAVMSQQGAANNLRYFMDTTFNYPTMAEAYRVAALNGFNRLF